LKASKGNPHAQWPRHFSILPPLKMSGLKIESHVESFRAIFGGMLFRLAGTTLPQKSPFLKKRILSFPSFS
jgi:hypothetical protein